MAETLCPTPVVSPNALAQLLEGPDADRIIVVDVSPCRPGVPHIPGALPFDLDGSMSDQSTGLPHTMLPADQFQARLRELGVNEDSHVMWHGNVVQYGYNGAWSHSMIVTGRSGKQPLLTYHITNTHNIPFFALQKRVNSTGKKNHLGRTIWALHLT